MGPAETRRRRISCEWTQIGQIIAIAIDLRFQQFNLCFVGTINLRSFAFIRGYPLGLSASLRLRG